MRPLTETIPKPLIPLVDRPFLHHVLDHLAAHGVQEAILSSPYLEGAFRGFLDGRQDPPTLTWITEPFPLGTAGAVANAASGLDETFLVLNGDILTDLDLGALLDAHRGTGAAATITVTPVEDARPFGLVESGEDGRVLAFREKPADPVPGLINAGTYVLEPVAIRGVPTDRAVSIERETFPSLISSGGPVFAHVSTAYWMDLGTPEKYLRATFDALEGAIEGLDYSAPHVDPRAEVDLRARLGRFVVAGPGASVGSEAEVEDSVLLAGSRVEAGARVRESIVGPGAIIGSGSTVERSVLAERAIVPPGATAVDARVGSGRTLGDEA